MTVCKFCTNTIYLMLEYAIFSISLESADCNNIDGKGMDGDVSANDEEEVLCQILSFLSHAYTYSCISSPYF